MAPRAKRNPAADAKAANPSGERSVVALPGFREIPKSLFPLTTEAAQAQYDALARTLFERGRLTLDKHHTLSSYAAQFDTITAAAASGKQVRGSWFAQLDKARKELDIDGESRPIAAPENAPENRFAHTGFPNRRR